MFRPRLWLFSDMEGEGREGYPVSRSPENRNRVAIVRLRPHKDGDYYNVETAHPARKSYPKNKGYEMLWERREPSPAHPGDEPSFADQTNSKAGQPDANAKSDADSISNNREK